MVKLKALLAWATSPKGQQQIHRAITSLLAIYVVIHRMGV